MNKELYDMVAEINLIQPRMERYGGSFEKGLAKALFYADIKNAQRIKEAFPEIWEKYKDPIWDN